jgi:hypothetical protein
MPPKSLNGTFFLRAERAFGTGFCTLWTTTFSRPLWRSSLSHSRAKKTLCLVRYPSKAIVRLLKRDCAPSERMIETSIRSEYREILANTTGQDPLRWYARWHQAYVRAQARNIPEISGQLAIQDFLVAVGKRFAPDWARWQLEDLAFAQETETARPSLSLEQLGRVALFQR